ncbi:MAG: phage tail assembly protein [Roseibium sp.]
MTKSKTTPASRPKTTTVALEFPFEHDGRDVKDLVIRRMRAGDALSGEGIEDEAQAGLQLLATLSDLDVEAIKKLDMEDFIKAQEAMADMMGKSSRATMQAVLAAKDKA